MKRVDTAEATDFFEVVAGTERSQAGVMNLEAGQSTGGPTNAHPSSDQWLAVVAGTGRATVAGESVPLREGTLVCIEAGETHEIECTGEATLRIVTVYAPPVY